MKHLFTVFILGLFFSHVNAQIEVTPSKPAYGDLITVIYDATQGNGALRDFEGDVYAHTGLITGKSSGPGDWRYVVADWNENKPEIRMKRLAKNKYELAFTVAKLYKLPEDESLSAFAFVFRNEDGSKVGKASGDQDIFHYVVDKPAFETKRPIVTTKSEAAVPEWVKDATLYEVNVRQFTEEGTFDAFEKHIPRLQKLGVDILWFMPIHPIGKEERKGSLGSYYSVQDYTAVNPEFGTMDDFKKLVEYCHESGFKVIIDWVANHTSRDHAWTREHPEWYNYNDSGQIVAPYDWTDVAELNDDSKEMHNEMIDEMVFWVKEVGIDGFRCDVAAEVPTQFWERAREALDEVKPVFMLAEDQANTSLLNKAFNANYAWSTHHAMNEIAKGQQTADQIYFHIEEFTNYAPKGSFPMQFITNHDENSWNGTIEERLGEGHYAFAVLYYTIPGMPLIYSGQEAGLSKRLEFFEKDPIPWYDVVHEKLYTKLNDLKADNPALWNGDAGGNFTRIDNDNPEAVVSFSRSRGGNELTVIINLTGEKQTVTLQNEKHQGTYRDYMTKGKVKLPPNATLELGAWQYHVLQPIAKTRNRKFKSLERSGEGFNVLTSDGTIAFTPYSDHTMEVEFIENEKKNPPSHAIAGKPLPVNGKLIETDSSIVYQTPGLSVHIRKEPLAISYRYQNQPLLAEEEGFYQNENGGGFRFYLQEEEKILGGGERVLGMDRRGHRLQLYNKPSYGYETKADLMYYSMPVALSSNKYMLVFDNGASGTMDIGATEHDILQFEAVGGRMSYLIAAADKWENLATHFTGLVGRQPMPPRWALGNISSRMGYHSQSEVEEVVAQYRADSISLDGIVLDLFWFGPDLKGHMGKLEWDRQAFPEPEKMMKSIRDKGVKTILITEPFLLKNVGYYKEAAGKGLLALNDQGTPYNFDFYFGETGLIDIFKKESREWFWNIYKKHTLTGVDGWWGDLGEPEVHPDDIIHINGRGEEVHNLYGHVWTKMVYEGFEKDFPEKRPVILMRSGFVGTQRYGILPWSGDVNRTWGGLQPQPEITLSMGLQGLGYMSSDLGGFAGALQDPELYVRWLQYGVFQPIFRTHAQEEVPAEPIYWDEETKQLASDAIEFRYRMTPYNYTLMYENATKGLPLVRPLFYAEDNMELFEHTTSYLWGDDILVAPIVKEGLEQQKVYLPKGARWMGWGADSSAVYDGGQEVLVTTSSDELPRFFRTGSFIPMCDPEMSLDEYNGQELSVLYIHDDSTFTGYGYLYEDDGNSKNAIRDKKYQLLHFNAKYDGKVLTIETSKEGYDFRKSGTPHRIEFAIANYTALPKSIEINNKKVKKSVLRNSWNLKDKVLRINALLSENALTIHIK